MTKARRSRESDVPYVKRSMNPFMVYSTAERANVAATGLPNNMAVTKELGRRWQALSDAERAPYIEEAKRLKAQHKKDHPDYKYQPRKKVKKADSAELSNPNTSAAIPNLPVEMPLLQQQYPSLSATDIQGPATVQSAQFQPIHEPQHFYNYQPIHRSDSNGSASSSSTPVEDADCYVVYGSHQQPTEYGYEYHGML